MVRDVATVGLYLFNIGSEQRRRQEASKQVTFLRENNKINDENKPSVCSGTPVTTLFLFSIITPAHTIPSLVSILLPQFIFQSKILAIM